MAAALTQSNLPLPNRRQGKVRDLYDVTLADGTAALALVASDRISAFDVVMPNGIPGKGVVLTQMSKFWFDFIEKNLGGEPHRLKHHVISTDPATLPELTDEQRASLQGRLMVGRRTRVVPVECVVRGYLAGSGWAEYQQSQTVCGIKLPPGLQQCDKLPEPIFTPATKEESGHDINISFERAATIVGKDVAERMREWSIAIYSAAAKYAIGRGIIIADTKFEFGVVDDPAAQPPAAPPTIVGKRTKPKPPKYKIAARNAANLILIDEVLTPDSSRFWPAEQYRPGQDQPSFDKQFLRNYLQGLVDAGKWDKTPPGPELPETVVNGTLSRYREAYRNLTGKPIKLD